MPELNVAVAENRDQARAGDEAANMGPKGDPGPLGLGKGREQQVLREKDAENEQRGQAQGDKTEGQRPNPNMRVEHEISPENARNSPARPDDRRRCAGFDHCLKEPGQHAAD